MTREEAIRKLQKQKAEYLEEWVDFSGIAEAYDMAIKALEQSEQRWIPCSERLPEAGSWAIWCNNKGIIQVARWKIDAIDHFFPSQGFFQLDDAIAWMPLPEPYKEEVR